jgi:uncharacterized protein
MDLLWTAFLLGFLGSFHCAGMCGPIALALPGNNLQRAKFLKGRFLYNGGRIITYSLLGVIFGIFGLTLSLAGLQQSISILSGVLILTFILLPGNFSTRVGQASGINSLVSKLKVILSKAFKLKGTVALGLIGMLNGLLPCGFVYLALAAALSAPSIWGAGLYMMIFGLGTFPVMMLIAVSGKVLNLNIRNKFNKAVPYIAFVVGVLFILRGLSLGIPYVSPKIIEGGNEKVVSCH